MATDSNIETTIRDILREHGQLKADVSQLGAEEDLYAAGMSSRASVSVMLGLEAAFDIEFPDEMLRREVFASIGAMSAAIEQLTKGS